jgi:hypothetical protein
MHHDLLLYIFCSCALPYYCFQTHWYSVEAERTVVTVGPLMWQSRVRDHFLAVRVGQCCSRAGPDGTYYFRMEISRKSPGMRRTRVPWQINMGIYRTLVQVEPLTSNEPCHQRYQYVKFLGRSRQLMTPCRRADSGWPCGELHQRYTL